MADLKALNRKENLKKNHKVPDNDDQHDCPVATAIDVIGGKWKVIILYQLRGQTLRFGELKRAIPKITQKMLSQQLRELEKDKLVDRYVYAEIPPKVEYRSTDLAEKLNPALNLLCEWGRDFRVAHEPGH